MPTAVNESARSGIGVGSTHLTTAGLPSNHRGTAYRARQAAADDVTTVQMLAYQIDGRHDQFGSVNAFVERLYAKPELADELRVLAGVTFIVRAGQ